jgi:hypothetical protein
MFINECSTGFHLKKVGANDNLPGAASQANVGVPLRSRLSPLLEA